MLIDKNWDFETAIGEISQVYYPGGITTGPVRNRLVESWGQLVGKTRAVDEFDIAIKKYGSLTAFGKEFSVSVRILRHFREFFSQLPDDQVVDASPVFISYSWDSDDHKKWVRELAARLRGDGINATLDQWETVPGDQLPDFMERAIRDSVYVLIICTHKYKERSDNRLGGVGYEGDIMTAEVMTSHNHRKFIPILRQQLWKDSAPNWLLGKIYIDLSSSPYLQKDYDDLLTTLLGTREKAPPIGMMKKLDPSSNSQGENSIVTTLDDFEPIHIMGIIVDQVGVPRGDGTRGSALYSVPFRLSRQPPVEWGELFIANWNNPSRFSLIHRPGIATIENDTVILEGTTIEEVRDYHRDTLVTTIQTTNNEYREKLIIRQKAYENEIEQLSTHKLNVEEISKQIKFTDE